MVGKCNLVDQRRCGCLKGGGKRTLLNRQKEQKATIKNMMNRTCGVSSTEQPRNVEQKVRVSTDEKRLESQLLFHSTIMALLIVFKIYLSLLLNACNLPP